MRRRRQAARAKRGVEMTSIVSGPSFQGRRARQRRRARGASRRVTWNAGVAGVGQVDVVIVKERVETEVQGQTPRGSVSGRGRRDEGIGVSTYSEWMGSRDARMVIWVWRAGGRWS